MNTKIYQNFLLTVFSLIYLLISETAVATTPELLIVTENLPPYQQYNNDGTVGGFSTEIINQLLKIVDMTSEIKMMSWARAYNIASNKKNVLIYSISKTPQRLDKFVWIGDFLKEKVCFWALKNNDKINKNPPKTEADLKNSIFVDTRLSITANYLLNNGYKNVYLTSRGKQGLEMLFANRADYILTTEYYLNLEAKRVTDNVNNFQRVLKNRFLETPLSIAFSRTTDPEIIEKFRQAFVTLKENGTLAKTIKKWRLKELSPRC